MSRRKRRLRVDVDGVPMSRVDGSWSSKTAVTGKSINTEAKKASGK